jgi:hypothetical protein
MVCAVLVIGRQRLENISEVERLSSPSQFTRRLQHGELAGIAMLTRQVCTDAYRDWRPLPASAAIRR